LVADGSRVAGAFRSFDLDVTGAMVCGRNALAVRVTAPSPSELAVNWVDWSPFPPDKDMGLWGPVSLSSTGAVRLRWPHVASRLALPSLASAELDASVEAENAGDRPAAATFTVALDGKTLAQQATLAPGEVRVIRFPPLAVAAPRIWWPAQMGAQELYDAGFA